MLMRLPLSSAPHRLAPKVVLGCEQIVTLATQADVVDRMRAPQSERDEVMKLQPMRLRTAPPLLIDVRAAPTVA
jgi:hypothetical protein